MGATPTKRDGDEEPEELFEAPEEHLFQGSYEGLQPRSGAAVPEPAAPPQHDHRDAQYARRSSGQGSSYRPGGEFGGDDIDILFSAYSGSRNVESRGRLFDVTGSSGEAYHSMQVVCAFLRYKLDPELQRRMPGLDIQFRPDDGTTSFDIHSQYRRKKDEDSGEDFGYVW